jgi:alkaline phosphatase D
MRRTAAVVLGLAAGLVCARAMAVDVVAGPMIGHVSETAARVWMQFPIAGEVSITVYDLQRNVAVSGVKVGLEGPSPFICDVPVNNLQADKMYRIEVKFDDQPVRLPGPDVVIRTAPAAGDEAVFTLGFGSDLSVGSAAGGGGAARGRGAAGEGGGEAIFKAITEAKPRAFLFLGNTGYLPATLEEFPTTRRAAFRMICDLHSRARQVPGLQELFRHTPCYSVYNDRDFGVAGADASFVFAQESLIAFQRFWPNPDWGTPQAPGCYSLATYGDVDLFLVDVRTFRVPPAGGAAAGGGEAAGTQAAPTLLGPAQLEWLKKNLKESRATFKVLAAPCDLFGKAAKDWGGEYPAEQAAFLGWLRENRIDGLIGLAGDQPVGQLLKLDEKESGLGYPVFTLGCSSLTDPPRAAGGRPAGGDANPHRVSGTVLQNNFGTLDFGGQREHRFVTLRLRDEAGKARIEQTMFALRLRNP